jgi:hypothetical protein
MDYAAADEVIAVRAPDGYGLLMRPRSGRYHTATPKLVRLWRLLDEQGLELQTAIARLADNDPDRIEQLRQEFGPEIAKLRRYGMLVGARTDPEDGYVARIAARRPPAPTRIAVTAADERAPWHYKLVAWAAYLAALLVIQRLPDRHRYRIMLAARGCRRQRPSLRSCLQVLATVRWILDYAPGWAGCDEAALPSFLALAVLGRAPSWVLAVSLTPPEVGFHAFLRVGDFAIDDAPQPDGTPLHPVIEI